MIRFSIKFILIIQVQVLVQGFDLSPDDFAAGLVRLDEHLEAAGRNRDEITKYVSPGRQRGNPDMIEQYREAGKRPSPETVTELLEQLRIYNPVTPEAEPAYREMLAREYGLFCEEEAVAA